MSSLCVRSPARHGAHARRGAPAAVAAPARPSLRPRRTRAKATSDAFAEVGSGTITAEQLKGERYIVFNRFECRDMKDSAARFEKRWTERKSRLADLDGFRFFSLLRRVPFDRDEELVVPEGEPNYMSFTVWEDKSGFNEWRKGDAFKEAHGGGSIFGFLDMILSSTMTLKGTPKPAFYDALIPISKVPESVPAAPGGWRDVQADGKNPIAPDVFVAQNRFAVDKGEEEAFEQRWASRESELMDCEGFVFFTMMRRDALEADDGFNYVSTTIWESREAFEAWRAGSAFKRAHGEGKAGGKPAAGKPMFSKPPSPALWEGKLMLTTPQGA